MLIENIEYLGFGSIIGEKITFVENKLNLVIEANEYGKSTMAESIWAIIYGLSDITENETANFKPWNDDAPYAGVLDLTINARALRIIRNFSDDSVQVLDRESQNDITPEFIEAGKESELGYKLTGMTKDLFRNTCLLGQRHLDEHHAGGNLEIRDDLKSLADSSTPGSTSQTAVDVIENRLKNFPFAQGEKPVEEVIKDLESQKISYGEKIEEIDKERNSHAHWLKEIQDIENSLSGQSSQAHETEFNNLKLEKFQLEERSAGFNERKGERDKIERRLLELSTVSSLADDSLESLKELWTRRESRIQDLQSMGADSKPEHNEFQVLEDELNKKYPNFNKFQPEEGNTISSLAISLYNLKQELDADRQELQSTTGAKLNNLISADQRLSASGGESLLTEEELEEARSYSSLRVAFNEQLIDADKRLKEAEFSRTDIEEKQKTNLVGNGVKTAVCAVSMVVCVVLPGLTSSMNFEMNEIMKGMVVGFLFLFLFAFVFFLLKSIKFKSYMEDEYEQAKLEETKILKVREQSSAKVANLENTLSTYATKAGLNDKEQLLEYLKQESSVGKLHDEHQSKENQINTKEQQSKKIKSDLLYYFNKIGRNITEVDSQIAMDLSQDIKQYFEERTKLDEQFSEIANKQNQVDFLEEELRDIEDQIRPILDAAGFDSVSDLDEIHEKIEELINVIIEKRELNETLSKLGYDMSSYESVVSSESQLNEQIEKIDEELAKLIELNPNLADLPDPDPDNPPIPVLPWGGDEGEKENLRNQKEELMVKLRTSISNRDNSYLKLIEELETVKHELVCAKRAKIALELARQKLDESSTKTYEDWSIKLNESASALISEMETDIESLSFDSQLNITVKLNSKADSLTGKEIKSRLSTGVKEQVHWLARMALSRFLSKREPLPIILDEPFSEADDQRFLRTMKFLLSNGIAKNQIIIFSCHKQRHEWLADQLSEVDKYQLNFVERQNIDVHEQEVVASQTE